MPNAPFLNITEGKPVKIIESPIGLPDEVPNIVLAAGFFDGVHLGHRQILSSTLACAREHGAKAWVLTFDPHPLAVIAPDRKPLLLTRLELRLELLAESGVDGCLLMPFTPELALLSPEQFISLVFSGWMKPKHQCTVVSGDNWRFGHDRAGSLAAIAKISHGKINVLQAPMVEHEGRRVSSSIIRATINNGDLIEANAMLGRPHQIRERTWYGRGIGMKLGFATANFRPQAEVLPPVGVYEMEACIRSHKSGTWMKSVANLGYRPTFTDSDLSAPELEVHILDFDGDLHGEELDVRFIRRLRDELKFDTIDALVEQVQLDILAVRSK